MAVSEPERTGAARGPRDHPNAECPWGSSALNPFNGELIPNLDRRIYVLAEYGTGAVMGVRPTTSAISFLPARSTSWPVKRVIVP